ncbi:MAG: hypothetical protein IJQ23_03935 [Clostridia bacterium]|nr:hypothetical protein [Clostridia bacterium]
MKGKKSSVIRMENLINGDRLKHSGEFSELLTGDVNRVLKDYFDYRGYPAVEVIKNGGFFEVKITLVAERLRAFSSLPQD